jgi:CheY-like chemotaxis protein
VASVRVLLVDDEEAVRLAAERVLTKLGHWVVTATDGAGAMAILGGERGGDIDIVLMDVTMPAMDGPATAAALRAMGVSAPIVLMSGYAEEDLVTRGMMARADGFLKKPFEVAELEAVVRELTSRPEPAR